MLTDSNRATFERAVDLLHSLLADLVFVSGSTTGVLLADHVPVGIRPTKDVDAIVNVRSYARLRSSLRTCQTAGAQLNPSLWFVLVFVLRGNPYSGVRNIWCAYTSACGGRDQWCQERPETLALHIEDGLPVFRMLPGAPPLSVTTPSPAIRASERAWRGEGFCRETS